MKVLLINGSPNTEGCTYTALSEIAAALNAQGIETEIAQIGRKPIRGCQACRRCDGHCVFDDDIVNEMIDKAAEADGIVVGSPVYYAGANGAVLALMDRMFFAGGNALRYKPAAAISSARRAGTTPTIDQLNKYFQINCMPVVSTTYWPMVHGNGPDEVLQDEEGLQSMRNLGLNMAWLLKCIEAGKAAGIDLPAPESGARTNFIR